MKNVRARIRPNNVGDRAVAYMLAITVGDSQDELIFYRRSRQQVVRLTKQLQHALNAQAWATEKKEVY